IGALAWAALYVLIATVVPTLEVLCWREPEAPERPRCAARESNLIAPGPDFEFALSDVRVELEPGSSERKRALRFVDRDGPLPIGAQIRGDAAVSVRDGIAAFASAPGVARWSLRVGFSSTSMLTALPFMLLAMALLAWTLGGDVEVSVRPGEVRARRRRWLAGGPEATLRYEAGERPRFAVERLEGREQGQAVLWGEAGGARVRLVDEAKGEPLDRIAGDLRAHFDGPALRRPHRRRPSRPLRVGRIAGDLRAHFDGPALRGRSSPARRRAGRAAGPARCPPGSRAGRR
ncbi:MAG TPA: hypothetical protein VFS00_30285, partial [Polyangiaceae bacterium]|nr:hypothetical protein [Polyangiaceae bacterium]